MLLIDFSWVLHRSYHVFKNLSFKRVDGVEVRTGTIFGLFNSYRQLRQVYPLDRFVFCLEGVSNFRRKNPQYKATREYKPEIYLVKKDILSMLALFQKVEFYTCGDGEADDVIYTHVLNNRVGEGVNIFTRDSDLLGLLEFDGVKIFNSIKNGVPKYVSKEEVKKKFGVNTVIGMRIVKTLKGDSTDNVPRIVNRFPAKLLSSLACSCATLEEVLSYPMPKEKLDVIQSQLENLRSNWELVGLREVVLKEVKPEIKPVSYFATQYGLNSLYRYLEMKPVFLGGKV